MRICGIDTGIRGGIAFYDVAEGEFFGSSLPRTERVVDIVDIPTIDDDGPFRFVNVRRLSVLLKKYRPDHVFMEAVHAMPAIGHKGGKRRTMGASGAMNFGDARGSIRSTVLLHGCDPVLVQAQAWKKAFRLVGPDKEQSRLRALQRMPSAAPYLKRKMDHGRAEALLIAIYGAAKVLGAKRAEQWNARQLQEGART